MDDYSSGGNFSWIGGRILFKLSLLHIHLDRHDLSAFSTCMEADRTQNQQDQKNMEACMNKESSPFGPQQDEWEDDSATNDLGVNPNVYRCPFHRSQDVYHSLTREEIEHDESITIKERKRRRWDK